MDEQAEPGEWRPDIAPVDAESPGQPLTPGEALMKLFLDNADHGRNAANDELIAALRQRAREIRALADLAGTGAAREDGSEHTRG